MNLSHISHVDNFLFIGFLILSVVLFYLFNRSKKILLLSGILFYASFSIKFTLLILLLAVINFILGIIIEKKRWKRILFAGIIVNLGFLGFFKYFNYFLDISNLRQIFNFNYFVTYAIPLGVSFFIFEFVHYIVDIKRGKRAIHNLSDFLIFVFFFPSLIAGPIKRFEHFIPQLKKLSLKWSSIHEGYLLIIEGFFKKIVLASYFSEFVFKMDNIKSYPIQTILGLYFFAFYIYFDFSGYIDIARGSAKLFGIELPINFNRPYFATSIQEFWRRWNITLMDWLKDYVYIPLGGSRKGKLRTYINILVVFSLSGLWHGAGPNFIAWGLYNGILLIMQKAIKPLHFLNFLPNNIKKYIAIIVTFHLVVIGWIFFNNRFGVIIDGFGQNHTLYPPHLFIDEKLILVLILLLGYFGIKSLNIFRIPLVKPIVFGFAILTILLFLNSNTKPFIYFAF